MLPVDARWWRCTNGCHLPLANAAPSDSTRRILATLMPRHACMAVLRGSTQAAAENAVTARSSRQKLSRLKPRHSTPLPACTTQTKRATPDDLVLAASGSPGISATSTITLANIHTRGGKRTQHTPEPGAYLPVRRTPRWSIRPDGSMWRPTRKQPRGLRLSSAQSNCCRSTGGTLPTRLSAPHAAHRGSGGRCGGAC